MNPRPFLPVRSGGNATRPHAQPSLPLLAFLLALPFLLAAMLLPRTATATETAPDSILLAANATGSSPVRTDTPLRVFILDQPPWSYLHEGQPQGAAVDVARAVLRRLGRNVEFVVTPFNRGLSLVRQGKLDAALTVYRTPEREQFLCYTTVPLYDEDVLLMVHPDDRQLANDTSGTARDAILYGDKPVAVALGHSYGPTLDAILSRKGLIRTSSFYSLQEGVQALLRGEVAAVPGAEPTLRALLHRIAPDRKLVVLRPAYDYVSAYMAFAPTEENALLAADFDATLGRMRASGEYARILAEADRILHAHQGQ